MSAATQTWPDAKGRYGPVRGQLRPRDADGAGGGINKSV